MKVEEFYDKKEKRSKWRAKFKFRGQRFSPTGDTKAEVLELVDEIRVLKRREKHNLPVPESPGPTLAELFDRVLPTISENHHKVFCTRVFKNFLALLPPGIRVKQLRKSHYKIYIDWRSPQVSKQHKKQIQMDTVYKELWAVSGAVGKGELYWSELETWKKPGLPPNPDQTPKKEKRRTKIVSPEDELYILLAELRKPRSGRQTEYTEKHRRRLADDLEFRYESGLRRKEVARLEIKQYYSKDTALRNVRRWKTKTVTKFFPLSARAVEIIESRIKLSESKYIFTKDGEPVDSDYRTLKTVCEKLELPYGRYVADGFVPHDLRHNFATDISLHGDIETTREYLGHSNIQQTANYLHTNEKRMATAMRKKEGIDIKIALVVIYKQIRRRKINAKTFIERIKKLTSN